MRKLSVGFIVHMQAARVFLLLFLYTFTPFLHKKLLQKKETRVKFFVFFFIHLPAMCAHGWRVVSVEQQQRICSHKATTMQRQTIHVGDGHTVVVTAFSVFLRLVSPDSQYPAGSKGVFTFIELCSSSSNLVTVSALGKVVVVAVLFQIRERKREREGKRIRTAKEVPSLYPVLVILITSTRELCS